MVELYKDRRYIEKNREVIDYIDIYFNTLVNNGLAINKGDAEIIRKIDNAEYTGNNRFKSKFGDAWITELSTGCKTAIIINHIDELGDAVVNVGECGNNVISYILSMGKNTDMLMEFKIMPLDYDIEQYIVVHDENGHSKDRIGNVFRERW